MALLLQLIPKPLDLVLKSLLFRFMLAESAADFSLDLCHENRDLLLAIQIEFLIISTIFISVDRLLSQGGPHR